MSPEPEPTRELRLGPFVLVLAAAAVSTALLHELGHWLAGTWLGNEMVMSLNAARPVAGYGADWHAWVVTAAGPAVTLLQAVLVWLLSRRGGPPWLFAFLLTPLVYRTMAMAMNALNPNDEGRLSLELGLGLYTLPALVCAFLLWLVVDECRRRGWGWRRPVLGGVAVAHLLGAVIVIDQLATTAPLR
jgi:hypothetical protein